MHSTSEVVEMSVSTEDSCSAQCFSAEAETQIFDWQLDLSLLVLPLLFRFNWSIVKMETIGTLYNPMNM